MRGGSSALYAPLSVCLCIKWALFSFLEGLVPVGVPLSKRFRRGGRSLTCTFLFRFSLVVCVVFHSTLTSSRELSFLSSILCNIH